MLDGGSYGEYNVHLVEISNLFVTKDIFFRWKCIILLVLQDVTTLMTLGRPDARTQCNVNAEKKPLCM